MIEVYVLIALSAIGYSIKKYNIKKSAVSVQKQKIPKNKKPSMKNLYESKHSLNVQKDENELYKKEFIPTNVVNTSNINNETLKHNNMHHFGNIKQPMNLDNSLPVFEYFTGISDVNNKSKREQKPFFELTRELGNINGSKGAYDIERTRMENELRIKNNILPFEQVRVGPGLNSGFSSNPMDKLSREIEERKFVLPKTIDDLRIGSNPKSQYEGVVIESGIKEVKRAEPTPIQKNRPDTTFAMTEDNYFKTTGAYLKPAIKPKFDVKYTNRKDTENGYVGNPNSIIHGKKLQLKDTIRQSNKLSSSFSISNAFFKKNDTDYGKSSIQIYKNNRDTTSINTYKGGLTSIVKAAFVPLTDALKITKKDTMIDNPREFGQFQYTLPEKCPARITEGLKTTIKETTLSDTPNMNLKSFVPKVTVGTNDVAKVTIKETTLAPTEVVNLKGPICLTVYNPDNVAKTTVKETTLQPSDNLNVRSGVHKGVVYDDTEIAKTTVKETTLQPSDNLNMRPGVHKGVVYDDDEIARTTVKETTINDTEPMNISNHVYKGQVYDPSNTAKTTIKETTLSESDLANMRSGVYKGVVYDTSDIARTTIKETLLDHETPSYLRITEMRGKMQNDDEIAKTTIRETLSKPDTNRVTRSIAKLGQMFDIDEQTLATTMKETLLSESIKSNPNLIYEKVPGGYVNATMNDKETHREDYVNVDYVGGSTYTNADGYKISNFEAKETNKETTTGEYFGGGRNKDFKPVSYEDIYNATINELRQEILVMPEPTLSGKKETYGKEDINVNVYKDTIEYDMTDFFEDIQKPSISDRDILPKDTRDLSNHKYVEKNNTIDVSLIDQLQDNPYMNPIKL